MGIGSHRTTRRLFRAPGSGRVGLLDLAGAMEAQPGDVGFVGAGDFDAPAARVTQDRADRRHRPP